MTARVAVTLALLELAGCAGAGHAPCPPEAHPREEGKMTDRLQTRAERTGYTETSLHADVIEFCESLARRGAVHVGSLGKSSEGRDIPYLLASRPLVRSAAEARQLGRPIVYVQANIHAGEVEGKEALQALVRDLSLAPGPNVLDSIVLVAVPIYNADGNEKLGPQRRNRPEQDGPELVGERPNGSGLDLNRDYVKAEAPETRAALALFQEWDPDVFVDLHATDGSLHGYALTYSPSLSAAAIFSDDYARTQLLPAVRDAMRAKHGAEVFDYGNYKRAGAELVRVDPDAAEGVVWATYDGRPRFGTNYYGLRGRLSVLSEAYSHDPFARRVATTYAFVSEILSYVAAHAGEVIRLSRHADEELRRWGNDPNAAPEIPLRARLTTNPRIGEILVAERAGTIRPVRMPIKDRFEPTLARKLPAGYVISADVVDAVVPLLEMHGIVVERLGAETTSWVQPFTIEAVDTSARVFQNHRETTLRGNWGAPEKRNLAKEAILVRTAQPRGIVAMYLLEPESDDGVVTWNFVDRWLAPGREYPVLRASQDARH